MTVIIKMSTKHTNIFQMHFSVEEFKLVSNLIMQSMYNHFNAKMSLHLQI